MSLIKWLNAKFKLFDFNDSKAATKTLTSKQADTNILYIDDARRSDFAGAGFVIEHDLDKSGVTSQRVIWQLAQRHLLSKELTVNL